MSNSLGDVTPAINELRKVYDELITRIVKQKAVWLALPEVVITIGEQGKRKELGWFRPQVWESQAQSTLDVLVGEDDSPNPYAYTRPSGKPKKMDEITISGECLNESTETIVMTMLHQILHQIGYHHYNYSKVHDNTHGYKYQRAGSVLTVVTNPFDAHYNPSFRIQYNSRKIELQTIIDSIDTTAFDLFRHKVATSVKGKMKLWHCNSCDKPAKLRTGSFVDATCNVCNTRILYADKDRFEPQLRSDLKRKGAQDSWFLP